MHLTHAGAHLHQIVQRPPSNAIEAQRTVAGHRQWLKTGTAIRTASEASRPTSACHRPRDQGWFNSPPPSAVCCSDCWGFQSACCPRDWQSRGQHRSIARSGHRAPHCHCHLPTYWQAGKSDAGTDQTADWHCGARAGGSAAGTASSSGAGRGAVQSGAGSITQPYIGGRHWAVVSCSKGVSHQAAASHRAGGRDRFDHLYIGVVDCLHRICAYIYVRTADSRRCIRMNCKRCGCSGGDKGKRTRGPGIA